jgi:short-subunit dehydrogenase involved in D-alanine esterification of teichoic acids
MHINVTVNVHLFTLYLPLIRKGQAKKIIYISTGMADIEMISNFQIAVHPIYSITKAAGNAAVAKFDAQYRNEGILFMSISPGLVNTSLKPRKCSTPSLL